MYYSNLRQKTTMLNEQNEQLRMLQDVVTPSIPGLAQFENSRYDHPPSFSASIGPDRHRVPKRTDLWIIRARIYHWVFEGKRRLCHVCAIIN